MTAVAVVHLEGIFADKIAEAIKKLITKILRKTIVKQLGKRALGALAALLAPDPTITKLIAIGMGVWMVWDLIDIAFWINEMRQWLVDEINLVWNAFIAALATNPNVDPGGPGWDDFVECITAALERAMASATTSSEGYRISGRLVMERFREDLFACLG